MDQAGLPGPGRAPQTQAQGRAAVDNGGEGRRNPGSSLAGDNGGRGKPGSPPLPVQRPAGCVPPAGGSPARSTGPFTAGIWTAASPAITCPTLLRTLPWRPWPTWAAPDGVSKPSSRLSRAMWGWTSMRPAPRNKYGACWHHHVALCLLGGAFLLSLQQDWGENDAPDHPAAGLPGGARDAAPGTVRAG